MDKDNPLFDPTAIDIVTAVNHLLSVIDDLHQKPPAGYFPPFVSQHHYKQLRAFAAPVDPQDRRDTSNLLNCLSRLLLVPLLTKHVVQAFRPIVIDLVARWLVSGSANMDGEGSSSIFEKVESVARAFSIMLPIVPQIKSLAVSFFTQSPSLFERLNTMNEYELAPEDQSPTTTTSLHTLLLTTYRLLSFSTSTFGRLWNWSPLFRLLSHPDEGVRYYTVMCLSMAFGMSDSQRWKALSSAIDDRKGGENVRGYVEGSERPILVDVDGVKIDLRMLTLWEQQILAEAQLSFIRNNYFNTAAATPILTDHDLSPLTTNLCGILLPKLHREFFDDVSRPPRKEKEALVLTPTTARNLHAIGLALSIGAPVLLEGMTGAGKTALVEEVARKTGRRDDLVKIHLGDQTDSKVLLGTYVSTSTPGSFRWQPGVLTTAVREGRWVLIEDIDLAPTEVVSVLLPLLETRNLFIPSRGEKIKAKEDFQLFATKSLLPTRGGRSVRSRGASAAETSIGSGLWTKVHVNTLSHEELTHVIQKRFPHLRALASNIMQVFQIIVSIYQDPNLSSFSTSSMGRYISTRDLMKWCHRINILVGSKQTGDAQALFTELGIDQTVCEDIFSEAVDCFCGMIVDYENWVTVLEHVGHALQISADRVRLYVESYIPNLKISDKGVSIGRVNLSPIVVPGNDQIMMKREKRRPFATTTHALRLLEKIAVCVYLCEPVLLVGETGTGKTTVVQYLADVMRQKLVVVNLSQQSDSSDLLGGFKPVDGKIMAIPLKEEFDKLFERTFSVKKNAKFLETVRKMYVHKKWGNFLTLLKQAVKMAEARFEGEQDDDKTNNDTEGDTADKDAKKGRKPASPQLRNAWKKFMDQVNEFEVQQDQMQNKFVFSFLEGALVKAVRSGDWILLDEINLASTETLECLSGLLQDAEGSLLLTEKGDAKPIQRHLNFRVFACMNPATDVGKRDLPPGLRNRFTEFYVHPPDSRREDLLQIVQQYISNAAHGDERAKFDVADFYLSAKELAAQHKLVDGANQRPHFSMRTLTRALTYVGQIAPTYGLRRSLYEGFCMTFLTQLNKESEAIMHAQVYQHLLKGIKNPRQMVSQIPKQPAGGEFIPFGYFWLEKGQEPVQEAPLYILTPSVEANLYNLARVVMSGKFPVLIQGPTSSGKTSMIEYLAKRTGHRFVRINNHEHTDLQEYLGTYVSNPDGQLVFQEGVLVEALRKGYWIVLDELNLAPSDVLEALNRLLDDNRELLIPETQEVVKPHPHFMLFATQNPAGLYGGRKALSRAFRNRFLELHFDDIPEDELETILSKRAQIAPPYCKRLVQVYKSLIERRQGTRIFEQKHGFITLRDLFRWAGRDAGSYQELAEHGYMLLAERCRKLDEKLVVKEVLETIMKVKLNEEDMYDCTKVEEFALYNKLIEETQGIPGTNKLVWTKAMRRLFTLVARCIRSNEPVLLVGETGCGKTTVCQMLAMARSKELHIVNCHQNTETADLLGGQRPVRNKASTNSELRRDLINFLAGCVVPKVDAMLDELDLEQLIAEFDQILKDENKIITIDDWMGTDDMSPDKLSAVLRHRCKQAWTLFEWHDGPLIQAMKHGDLILLDEISLADDSVLERLNSVLEPHRLLVLAEKGGKAVEELIAQDGFQFLATMNPGGDYGKKELSPALRNRFTEIWVSSVTDKDDLVHIISEQLKFPSLDGYAIHILEFVEWYTHALGQKRTVVSLRDILSWVNFLNTMVAQGMDSRLAFVHGGCLILLDGLGSNASSGSLLAGDLLKDFRRRCLNRLVNIGSGREDMEMADEKSILGETTGEIESTETLFGVHPFHITKGQYKDQQIKFTLRAPTTSDNAMRVFRAMQVKKPILLEGSPGVGKTSLISALADATGHKLVRINLSEQTDLMDLFGSDLPVEGGNSGEFAWRDAPFLQAMKAGDWVLLDELNLASQSVLEGLNSCLDHRGAVYIPELDREFFCASEFRVFGAQNPLQQGGGRKGLPKSFVNRFTQVFVAQLTKDDLLFICSHLFPEIESETLCKMIQFNTRIYDETMIKCSFGRKGSPWEFNLRDVFRWLDLMQKDDGAGLGKIQDPAEYLDMVYLQRMRVEDDRRHIISIFEDIFGKKYNRPQNPSYHVSRSYLQVGHSMLQRVSSDRSVGADAGSEYHLLQISLAPMQNLMKCVEMNWMAILTGPSGSGKTSLVRLLAQLTGRNLKEFAMNSGVDTMELLGGFEQVDLARHRQLLMGSLRELTSLVSKELLLLDISRNSESAGSVLRALQQLNDGLYTLESQVRFTRDSLTSAIDNTVHASDQAKNYEPARRLLEILRTNIITFNLTSFLADGTLSVASIEQTLRNILILENEHVIGRFEWIDGALINALEHGHWFLIDNANLCNPSVLDRLNPLFEPNGMLMVNERGLVNGKVKIIRPHTDFRIFMTVDPRNGELSRAMRNRGIEIALVESDWVCNQQDTLRMTNSIGLRGSQLPAVLGNLHAHMQTTAKKITNKSLTSRDYLMLGGFIAERLQRGEGFARAVRESFDQTYVEDRNFDHQTIQQSFSILDGLVSSDNSAALNAISPANSPLLLAGSLYQNESVTAMVLLQGAYLIYLLQNEGSPDIIQADNNVYLQNNSRATIAADFFFENLSMADMQWRLRWLNYIVPLCSSSLGERILSQLHFAISSVSKHPIMGELDDMRQQISNFVHIPNGFVESLPIDITSNANLINVIEAKINEASTLQLGDVWSQYRIAIQAYRLLVRLVKLEFLEQSVYHDAEKQRLGNLTIMQQSYCHQRGRLGDHQLTHPIVAFFYPLTVAIKTGTLSWINNRGYAACTENVFDSFGELFDKYDTVWTCLYTAAFELGEVLLCIKMMRKSTRFLLNLQQADFNTALQVLDQITAGFNMTTGKTMRLLWKHFHPTTLSTAKLFEIESRLQEIGKEFNVYLDDGDDGPRPKPTDLVVTSNLEMKRTLIEGISTLYFLDSDNSEKAKKLAQSIDAVPEHLRHQVAQHKLSQKSVQAGSAKSQWELALVPLMDYSSIIKEINIICRLYPLSAYECLVEEPDVERIIAGICKLRDFSLTQSSRPPLDFISHQRLIWILEDPSNNERKPADLNGITQDIIHRWHERLWRNSYHRQKIFDLDESKDISSVPSISQGPSSLFESVETLTYLNLFRSINKMPVKAYDDALQQFKNLQKHLASEDVFENRHQIELLTVLFVLQQTVDAFEPLLKADAFQELRDAFRTLKPLVKYILDTSLNKVQYDFETARATLETLAQGLRELPIQQQLVTAIQLIMQSLAVDGSHFLRIIGKARVYLGLAFVSGYIPDYPLDPMAKPRFKKRLLEEKKSSLTNEISVRQSIEDIHTGENTNILIMSKLQELARVNTDIRSSLVNFSLRPEKSQLNDVFSDLRYLQKTMIERHVESLLLELEDGSDSTILQRERLFQDNALQFIHRMSSKYPMYRDILQPLLVAVQEIKYGLRLMSTGLVQQKNPDRAVLEAVLLSLLRTPEISAAATNDSWRVISQRDNLNVIKKTIFSSPQLEKKWNIYLKYLIVALRRVFYSIDVSGHLQIDQMKTLEALFGEILDIWKAAEEHAKKLAVENESLYKQRTKIHQGLTDEQIDEIDFKQTFADFNEEFADLEDEQLDSGSLNPASTMRSPIVDKVSMLDDENIQNVGVIHRSIFRSYNYAMTGRPSKGETWQQSMWHSYNMASEIASMADTTFSHTLDTQCRGAHLLSTSFTIARFDSGDKIAAQDTIYDFYRSENVPEAKHMYPIVNSLKIRILELLDQWPEHATLQQLVTISDRLAAFSITSPIAKLLTGVELLLQKSEDWESYASRDVSIKSHREAIIALIVSWRQLELNCWPKLLAAQDVYHQNAAYKWWFHLYNTIIRSALISNSNNDDINHRTKDLLGTLDQFLQSSPLSEFSTRLELIHTFHSHLRAQVHFKLSAHQQLNEDSRLMHESVADVLDNVYKYYLQFLASANAKLEQLRKPIEKDLKEFVKIASWKDVNIHALKQSAQRTHRQLHKCIRKYKEVLARSMTDVIAAYQQEVPIFQARDEKHYEDHNPAIVQKLASSADIWISSLDVTVPQLIDHRVEEEKERFANLERTWTKLKKYCEEDLVHFHSSTMQMPLEEFVTDIITQIKTFQQETPHTMTEENKSLVKNQKTLKKKALVDFLKQLKRIGVKQRVHVIAQQNQDQGYIFRLPSVALASSLRDLSLQKPPLSCYNWASDELEPLWSKASDYYYRVLARISHLRTVISTNLLSKDVTLQEIEKGAGSTEYLLSLLISERNSLHKMENNLGLLHGVAVQLASIYESSKTMSPVHLDTVKAVQLLAHKMHTDKVADSLAQALSLFGIQTNNFSGGLRDHERLLKDLQICAAAMGRMREEVDFLFTQRYLYPNAFYNAPIVVTDEVIRTIEVHHEIFHDIHQKLVNIMHAMPESRHIFGLIEAYISNIYTQGNPPNDVTIESLDTTSIIELRDKSNSVIDSILISIQELRELKKSDAASEIADAESEYGMRDSHIRAEHDRVLSIAHQLRLETVAGRSIDLINQLAILMKHRNPNDHQSAILVTSFLQRVYPFLQQHIYLTHHTLAEFLLHHKSMAKLTFVMCNTFTTIFTKGFCIPEGAAEDSGDGVEDGVQGTGIGEGEGKNDVSDQIEDEEQVLGTQNDKQPDPEKQDMKEEKKGMEMENDFDGQLEDVEDEAEKDDEGSEGESEAEEMDEQIGDIDDMNPDAVDDKMWGDDSANNLDESDKKVDQDQSTGQQDQSDIVAKDNQEKSEKNGEKPQKNEQKVSEEQDEQAPEGFAEEDEEGENGDEDENEGSKPGEQFNVDIPEAETLELPDDMNLDDMDGEDGEEKGDGGDEFVDNMDVDGPEGDNEQEENDGDETFKDKLDDTADEENAQSEPLGEENDATIHDAAIEEEKQEETEAGDEKQDQNHPEEKENLNKPDEDKEDTAMEDVSQSREQPNNNANTDNDFGVQGDVGKVSASSFGESEGNNKDAHDSTASKNMPQKEKEESGKSNRGNTQADKKTETSVKEQGDETEKQQEKTNPRRSLGDALKSWRRRLNDVADAEEDENEPEARQDPESTDAKVDENQSFEYLKNDDDSHDMQTMGSAAEDQVKNLGELGAIEEKAPLDPSEYADMEVDDSVEETNQQLSAELTDPSGNNDKGAILSKRMVEKTDGMDENEVQAANASHFAHEPLEQEEIDRMREELEMKVTEWRETGKDGAKARELWQTYENLTHDLAFGLCEQLRLILEPTMATKLKGDYRTGKRLNMKRIIPYIASQFKKDKIWLRRTKPSKRQYQVMIAVDDSKSMSESHSIQLAYETLALISKALSQLEVGDISIISFGERVQLLHPFDQPFTDEGGASVLQQFTFAQQKTYVKNLVETSIGLLEHARSNHSGPRGTELWQLQLIISDGICEDHDAVRALVRRAAEHQIMVIFIIVDNKAEKDSILATTNVKYKNVGGKMTLQMERYLDSFPFEYYLILRDVNALPEVLSDALRQYFSLVAG